MKRLLPAPQQTITQAQYGAFQKAYDFFNGELFDSSLPPVLVLAITRKRRFLDTSR